MEALMLCREACLTSLVLEMLVRLFLGHQLLASKSGHFLVSLLLPTFVID